MLKSDLGQRVKQGRIVEERVSWCCDVKREKKRQEQLEKGVKALCRSSD